MKLQDLYKWKERAENAGSGAVGINGTTLEDIIGTAIRGCQARILLQDARGRLLESASSYDPVAISVNQFLNDEPCTMEVIEQNGLTDLILWSDFAKMCFDNSLTDYDGMGNWANATQVQSGNYVNPRWIYPSQIVNRLVKKPDWATHVLWHNR